MSVASNPDILIIGAGLAGAAAAEALAARGFTATVLEARDRVGGRGFSRPFADSDELLEFGGGLDQAVASTYPRGLRAPQSGFAAARASHRAPLVPRWRAA